MHLIFFPLACSFPSISCIALPIWKRKGWRDWAVTLGTFCLKFLQKGNQTTENLTNILHKIHIFSSENGIRKLACDTYRILAQYSTKNSIRCIRTDCSYHVCWINVLHISWNAYLLEVFLCLTEKKK